MPNDRNKRKKLFRGEAALALAVLINSFGVSAYAVFRELSY